jgi:ankyrin repeat protein
VDLAKLLLDHKADMFAKDTSGQEPITYLYVSLTHGKWNQIIEQFLNHGFPVNKLINGRTLLVRALQVGDCSSVKLLIKRGADVYLKNQQNQDVVDISIIWKHCMFEIASAGIRATKRILQADPNIINSRDEKDNTLLHHAVLAGDDAWVAYLLSMGANPEITNIKGQTPLQLLVEIGGGPNYRRMVGVFAKAAREQQKKEGAEVKNVPAASSSSSK